MTGIDLFETILDSLTHLIAGADTRINTVFPKSKIQSFDGFELFDPRMDRDETILIADTVSDAPIWPMDARLACWKDENNIHGVPGWIFTRVSTLKMKDWRGRLKYTFPRMVEISDAFVDVTGRSTSAVAAFGIKGNGIVDAMAYHHPGTGGMISHGDAYGLSGSGPKGSLDLDDFKVRAAYGIELRREYLWSVLLGEEGIPRARFVTDPIGVREAFRLRDIPPGRARRAALRHWVRNHWRQKRDASADDRTFIRAYLRGATNFGWNGLGCTIEPSRDDIRRASIEKKDKHQ